MRSRKGTAPSTKSLRDLLTVAIAQGLATRNNRAPEAFALTVCSYTDSVIRESERRAAERTTSAKAARAKRAHR